jgi:hypothetical protein
MSPQLIDLLPHASLFLYVATNDDIEAERVQLEQLHDKGLQVHRVTHETRSGARVTRVEWEVT